jgi:predicted Fe-Mo cluster-binding NifX family protein
MKIAVASSDGISISQHFGRSTCFIVFDIEGEQIMGETVVPNTSTAFASGECQGYHEHHDQPHSHDDITAALRGCAAVLCHGMGWRAAEDLGRNGIKAIVLDKELPPKEAVQRYLVGTLTQAVGFCRCHE